MYKEEQYTFPASEKFPWLLMNISEDHHLYPPLPHFLNNLAYIALLLKFMRQQQLYWTVHLSAAPQPGYGPGKGARGESPAR